MKNIAVILAGGSGKRAGEGVPKQLRCLADGRTVLETCVAAFEANECIDEIAVVMLRDCMPQAQAILEHAGMKKVRYWIEGGSERWESSLNAVKALHEKMGEQDGNVLLHDCARPFVSQDILTRVCRALEEHPAVTVAIPVTDTIYEVESGEWKVESIPPRGTMMRAQTPQAFRLSLLLKAYQQAEPETLQTVTDDAGVVRAFLPQEPIYVVLGEEANRKLTFREDFLQA